MTYGRRADRTEKDNIFITVPAGTFLSAHITKGKQMTINEMFFKGLPFQPKYNQVFYIENGYDAEANDFICKNYIGLKAMFNRMGMEFFYLPYLLKEHDIEAKVRYYAPYLSSAQLTQKVGSNAFAPYLSDDAKKTLKPSFIFGGRKEGGDGDVCFMYIRLSDIDVSADDAIDNIERSVQAIEMSCIPRHNEQLRKKCVREEHVWEDAQKDECCDMSMPCPPSSIDAFSQPKHNKTHRLEDIWTKVEGKILSRRHPNRFCIEPNVCYEETADKAITLKTEDELAEEHSLVETAKVLSELRMTVQKLRLEGVSLMAIHEFIDKQEPLSRMTITHDYRIFLPDYNHMEIEMGALPKAIYFLYLRYPEGIICKHMLDYYSELLNIYRQLRPNTDEARLNLTITKVVNPLGNALNENIARIRKAFVEKFDEHLANNYIVTGERGLQYSIPLERELITWEE